MWLQLFTVLGAIVVLFLLFWEKLLGFVTKKILRVTMSHSTVDELLKQPFVVSFLKSDKIKELIGQIITKTAEPVSQAMAINEHLMIKYNYGGQPFTVGIPLSGKKGEWTKVEEVDGPTVADITPAAEEWSGPKKNIKVHTVFLLTNPRATVRVTWPSGRVREFRNEHVAWI